MGIKIMVKILKLKNKQTAKAMGIYLFSGHGRRYILL